MRESNPLDEMLREERHERTRDVENVMWPVGDSCEVWPFEPHSEVGMAFYAWCRECDEHVIYVDGRCLYCPPNTEDEMVGKLKFARLKHNANGFSRGWMEAASLKTQGGE